MSERWTDLLQVGGFLTMVGGVAAYSLPAAAIVAGGVVFVAAGLAQRRAAQPRRPEGDAL